MRYLWIFVAIIGIMVSLAAYQMPMYVSSGQTVIRDFYGMGTQQLFTQEFQNERNIKQFYEKEYLSSVQMPFVRVNGQTNVLFRFQPQRVRIENKDYYFLSGYNTVLLSEKLEEIQNQIPVLFYNRETFSNFNLFDVLGRFINPSGEYKVDKYCSDTVKNSLCDSSSIEKFDYTITPLENNKGFKYSLSIFYFNEPQNDQTLVNGIRLFDDWQVCTSKCESQKDYTRTNLENTPVKFLRDGNVEREVQFRDLKISEQELFNSRLRDYSGFTDLEEPIERFDAEVINITYPYKLKLKITPSNNVKSAFVDKRFDNLMFESKACKDKKCEISFNVEFE